MEAVPSWNISTARWSPSIMAWVRNGKGHVAVLYGHRGEHGQHLLRIEPLMPLEEGAEHAFEVYWQALNDPFSSIDEEA